MISKVQYLTNPCKTSSIPFWKAKSIVIPAGVKILHQKDFRESDFLQYIDEPYFRLRHDLMGLSEPEMPEGYSFYKASLEEFAEHINSCYDDICMTVEELRRYTSRAVYDAALWVAVRDLTGNIVATGIAELDCEIGEGSLEWIQVSEGQRGKGLGRYIVSKLLWQLKEKADFVTVSGQCSNPTKPEMMYRKCGFTGSDVWHILRKR